MAEVNYSKLTGIILPVTTMGMFEAIKYCDYLKQVTGEVWKLITTNGRLIYTRDVILDESNNVDNDKAFRDPHF